MSKFASIGLIAILWLIIAVLVHAEMCTEKITKYYRNAELNQFPAKPTDPISSAEANQFEEEGSEYFIHEICDSETPISLVKRWNNKVYFEIKYLYLNKNLIGQKSTNLNGVVNEYYIE